MRSKNHNEDNEFIYSESAYSELETTDADKDDFESDDEEFCMKSSDNSCSYCRCSDTNSLARCRVCNKWFCNNRTFSAISHIVSHLNSSSHAVISLHQDSKYSDLGIQCHYPGCSENSIFSLFFIGPADRATLICKEHVSQFLQENPARTCEPLILNKGVNRLLQESAEEDKGAELASGFQIDVLEQEWSRGRDVEIEDLSTSSLELSRVKYSYVNRKHYLDTFLPLVELERDYERRQRNQMNNKEVSVGIEDYHGQKVVVFGLPREGTFLLEKLQTNLKVGDDLMLYPTNEKQLEELVSARRKALGEPKPSANRARAEAETQDSEEFRGFLKQQAENAFDSEALELLQNLNIEGDDARPSNSNQSKAARNIGNGLKFTIIAFGRDSRLVCRALGRTSRDVVDLNTPFKAKVEFLWSKTTFERLTKSLKKFSEKPDMGSAIEDVLLGKQVSPAPLPNIFKKAPATLPGLPPLNKSQEEALAKALHYPFSLIQGPPGTGKTTLSANIIYNLILKAKEFNARKKMRKKNFKKAVLVCAPSNTAIDHITDKLIQGGVSVLRIFGRLREVENRDSTMMNNIENTALHIKSSIYLIKGAKKKVNTKGSKRVHALIVSLYERAKQKVKSLAGDHSDKKTRDLNIIKEFNNLLSYEDSKDLRAMQYGAERKLTRSAQVVCTTCVTAGRLVASEKKAYSYVLIDESTQSTEPETLIPLLLGASQVVLVGDHFQLGPVIQDKLAKRAGLGLSLFEKLIRIGAQPSVLTTQYRMHPKICEFPNNAFYKGILQTGVEESQRVLPQLKGFFPNAGVPYLAVNCEVSEELASNGTTYFNRGEVEILVREVRELLGRGLKPSQIGVITPYEGQKRALAKRFEESFPVLKLSPIEIASVDSFQGREKEVILMSCVRSNSYSNIGFLGDYRRLNVAITRARIGNVLVGNFTLLASHPLWRGLIAFLERNKVITNEKHVVSEVNFSKLRENEDLYGMVKEHIEEKRFQGKKKERRRKKGPVKEEGDLEELESESFSQLNSESLLESETNEAEGIGKGHELHSELSSTSHYEVGF